VVLTVFSAQINAIQSESVREVDRLCSNSARRERPSISEFLAKLNYVHLTLFTFSNGKVIAAVADAIDRPAIESNLGAHLFCCRDILR